MNKRAAVIASGLLAALSVSAFAADPALHVQVDKPAGKVSPTLYGLMTEEINFSYDGGLYAELIRNRAFKEDLSTPAHWSLEQADGGTCTATLDVNLPLSAALPVSLKLNADSLTKDQHVSISNEGYWGIPVKPGTTYKASFYAKRSIFAEKGPLTVAIESKDGKTVFAKAEVPALTNDWAQYSVTLTTGADVTPSTGNRFTISTGSSGTFWFNLVSLFPPTYNDRANGNRRDLMQMLVDMKPAFLRFPGGNYLEGNTIEERFDWKNTVGPLIRRSGHPSPWKYASTDGMGLLEYLEWTEDMHAEPVLAVFAGYALRKQAVPPGPALQLFVQEAMDEIEYVTGDAGTKWGAQRIADGHPEPFKLRYIEVGNEDWFDRTGSYEGRFAQFDDAIKAKYPAIQVIATTPVKSRAADMVDEHYYKQAGQFYDDATHYDKYPRDKKIFVGEWATREGVPTTNMNAALGDAAWMTGMERNSDVVQISCYAPLFVNVNPGGMQWKSDLIGYDAMNSYGSPSYYVQKLFATKIGDTIVPVAASDVPTQTWQPSARRGVTPPAKQVPSMFFSATEDSKTGMVYLKVVNTIGTEQNVTLAFDGVKGVAPKGKITVVHSEKALDTNSIVEPTKIVPVEAELSGLGATFTHAFPAYSVSVMEIPVQ